MDGFGAENIKKRDYGVMAGQSSALIRRAGISEVVPCSAHGKMKANGFGMLVLQPLVGLFRYYKENRTSSNKSFPPRPK